MQTKASSKPRFCNMKRFSPDRWSSLASGPLPAPEGGGGIKPTVKRSGTVGIECHAYSKAPEGGGGRRHGVARRHAFRRPLRGLTTLSRPLTHSSASLHCGLYSVAPFRGWENRAGAGQRDSLTRGKNRGTPRSSPRQPAGNSRWARSAGGRCARGAQTRCPGRGVCCRSASGAEGLRWQC